MVAHEHISMDFNTVPLRSFTQEVQINEAVMGCYKTGTAIIPSLNNVVSTSGRKQASTPGHMTSLCLSAKVR
jgi:hypothetical protein